MHVLDPVEILYLGLMHRWERKAPADKHEGLLDGEPARNTQTARLIYVLQKVAAGNVEHVYSTLALHKRRADGESYVSKTSGWMKQPFPLGNGWFFEGCTSLPQKQAVIHGFSKLGLSAVFSQAAEDFVAHKSIERYFPTEAEATKVLAKVSAVEREPEP